MKRLLPYVFPVVAIVIILALILRWYQQNTQPQGEIPDFASEIEIENITPQEAASRLNNNPDLETVEMVSLDNSATGEVRYQVTDGTLEFSVTANLPELEEGLYQVWLQELDGEGLRKAVLLDMSKAGWMASAALSAEVLPFRVVVSQELVDDDQLETRILEAELTNLEESE